MKIAKGKFPCVLQFTRKELLTENLRVARQKRMSLSGAQVKCALVLSRGVLRPAKEGELSTHILKPIPSTHLPSVEDVPANEDLTMQIAETCFGISTAAHALVSFSDGEPAYVTRRFDRAEVGGALHQEDFCQLSAAPEAGAPEDFKYEGSYEELGDLILRHSSAPRLDCRRFFSLVVFNYLISNGDAHRKNFSLLSYGPNDSRLSPAYDLLCTRLHFPDESRMALDLLKDDEETPFYSANGFRGIPDFIVFGARLGLSESDCRDLFLRMTQAKDGVLRRIDESRLSSE